MPDKSVRRTTQPHVKATDIFVLGYDAAGGKGWNSVDPSKEINIPK
jgi:hypothetical protein